MCIVITKVTSNVIKVTIIDYNGSTDFIDLTAKSSYVLLRSKRIQ